MELLRYKLKAVSRRLQGRFAEVKSVTIFVTGKTGAGKSSLINKIAGLEVAKEGRPVLDRGTTELDSFEYKYDDVKITFWVSPGLQDGLDQETRYIRNLQSKGCADSDLFLYCIRMNEQCLKHDDIDAIRKLTRGLGSFIWKNALFVLTFADKVEPPPRGEKLNPVQNRQKVLDHFKKRLAEWKKKLQEAVIKAGVDAKVATSIPVVPAGHKFSLPDCDNWLSLLWQTSILRMKKRSQLALLKVNLHCKESPDQIHQFCAEAEMDYLLVCNKPKLVPQHQQGWCAGANSIR